MFTHTSAHGTAVCSQHRTNLLVLLTCVPMPLCQSYCLPKSFLLDLDGPSHKIFMERIGSYYSRSRIKLYFLFFLNCCQYDFFFLFFFFFNEQWFLFIYSLILSVLGLSCGMWDLLVAACGLLVAACRICSLTRDRTRDPCIGSTESYPLDHQGSPSIFTFSRSIGSFSPWHSSKKLLLLSIFSLENKSIYLDLCLPHQIQPYRTQDHLFMHVFLSLVDIYWALAVLWVVCEMLDID